MVSSMLNKMLKVISAAMLCSHLALALPQPEKQKLQARQDIDFDLVNSTPDPTILPGDTSNFNAPAAIAAVKAAVTASPLPQSKRSLEARDIIVNTYPGYTDNIAVANAAMNAPMDCNGHSTYMGAKLFTSTAFDTALCAAACSAQSAYNLRHPPANGPAQTCQFYNTYAMYKNDVYQGQYCTLYNQTWDGKYATNTGQTRGSDRYTIQDSYIASNITDPGKCPQAITRTPLDLTATNLFNTDPANILTTAQTNLVSLSCTNGNKPDGLSTRIDFPTTPNHIYEITFDYYQQPFPLNNGHYFIEVGDEWGYLSATYWTQPSSAPAQVAGNIARYSATLQDGTGAQMEMCWNSKVVPQVAPQSGVWNTGKVVLKPRTETGYFRWDFSEGNPNGVNGLQWRNVFVTEMSVDYCK